MYLLKAATTLIPFKRIVCTVPSITELLHYFQLNEETIGITKFCIHPNEWFIKKEKVGGTKNLNIEKIISLRPDLIICSKEENVKAQIDLLAENNSVFVTDVKTYEEALQMIFDIGLITNKLKEADDLVTKIKTLFKAFNENPFKKIDCVYVIWKDPFMTIGGDTFIHSMMQKMGLNNLYASTKRYPNFSIDDIKKLQPQLMLLSSEPYPFSEKHLQEIRLLFPTIKVLLANGEIFSWYGSRMLLAPTYFNNLQKAIDKEQL
jgi:ABC-type Fe3+-hydroxamate transport system substrate-binding protein